MRVFVTGASGWIGSAVVPELIAAGHHVTGLARSDRSAAALIAAGADVRQGTLDDADVLAQVAAEADGVIHLAFKHDIAFSGDYQGAVDADRRAVETMGDALAGSGRPFVLASGTLGIVSGRVVTERDAGPAGGEGHQARSATAQFTLALASRGVRSVVVRLPPSVHGRGDRGFVPALISLASATGISRYVGDGTNRWPAVHRLDAAALFRLALERAPAGSVVHAVADTAVPFRDIAGAIGRHLNVPVTSVSADDAARHFGWLAAFVAADGPASSALTRELLRWEPTHPGLLDDLNDGQYFDAAGSAAPALGAAPPSATS